MSMATSQAETLTLLDEQDSGTLDESNSDSEHPLSAARYRSTLLRHACWLLYALVVVALAVLLAVFVYRDYHDDCIFLTSDDTPGNWTCPPPLPASPFPASRVLVLSADNRPLPALSALPADVDQWPYYVLTHASNLRYAAYHNYSYQRIAAPMPSTRASSWSKLYYLAHTVDWAAYDYVVGVDSDAWFTRLRYGLHDMLNCFAPDALPPDTPSSPLLVVSHDWADNEEHANDLNAGVFIVRLNAAARAVVDLWWRTADLPAYAHLQHRWPFEQGVLNEVFMRNATIAARIRVLPRNVIYGHAAAYVSHVTSYWPGQPGWRDGRRERLIKNDMVRADLEDILMPGYG